ncbi:MAG: c-type cytochrome, partial [Planctomycetales bacterium]|nr:c-type cytochrome [Planctomycetales bacterium]
PALSKCTTAELTAMLDHANAWHRETAARLLYERQDAKAAPQLEELARAAKSPQARIAALNALAGLNALRPAQLWPALEDDDPHVRRAAVRLCEPLMADSPALRDALCSLVDDSDLGVRYQLAFTLGEFHGPRRDDALAALLLRDAGDRWMRVAVGTSLRQGSGAVLVRLMKDGPFVSSPSGREVVVEICSQIGRQQRADDVAALTRSLAALADDGDKPLAQAMLTALDAKEGTALRAQVDAATGGQAAALLAQLVADAKSQLSSNDLPVDKRVALIAQLRLGRFADVRATLDGLLAADQPEPVQAATVDALATFDAPEVADLLIERWSTFTPTRRRQAGDVLFSRAAWIAKALRAVESQAIPLSEITPEHFERIDKRVDPALAERAAKLIQELQSASPRSEVVKSYASALDLHGDREAGRAAFARHCAACHKVEGKGYDVGPNLAAMRNRGAAAILVNVLDPNREVNPQYVNYVAVGKDGRTVSGLIAAETAGTVTLARGEGAADTLLRVDIEQLKSTGVSLMPEGLEKQIDQQTMADLLAYLLTAQ